MLKHLSPSLGISLLALVIALGGAGYSATGGTFILGQTNVASTPTVLRGPIGSRTLQINNGSTATDATALVLGVAPGHAPFRVNNTVKVPNLNADLLDGLDSDAFALRTTETWNYVGDPGKPAFANGWNNFSSPGQPHNLVTYQHAAYRKDGVGIVHLGGLVSGGTIGQAFFVLPDSHCPFFTKVFPAISNNAFARITINRLGTGGCAVFANIGSNAWVSLEGVSFLSPELESAID